MDKKKEWEQLAEWYQSKDARTDWLLGYPEVLRLLGNIQGKRVLDYGCGNGTFSRFLVQNYPLAQVIGVDTAQTAIVHAQQKTDPSMPIEYHHIHDHRDIARWTYDAACFNFVFCTIPNFETIVDIFRTTYAQLPVGGSCVLLDPHPTSHGKRFISFQSDVPRTWTSGEPVHVRLFTQSIDLELDDYYWTEHDYHEAISAAGFSAIETRAPILGENDFSHVALRAEKTDPPFIIIKATK